MDDCTKRKNVDLVEENKKLNKALKKLRAEAIESVGEFTKKNSELTEMKDIVLKLYMQDEIIIRALLERENTFCTYCKLLDKQRKCSKKEKK